MNMGSLKNPEEDHQCHDVLLESPILTNHSQWHADSNSNSSPDLNSESDAASDCQTSQGTQGLDTGMAMDQLTSPSESSKVSGSSTSPSPSPSPSSEAEADQVRSELSHGLESCQFDPVPSLREPLSGVDLSPSHVSVNSDDRPDQLGDGDDDGDIMSGQCDQWREGSGGEKSCPPIRRDVSQEITILVTSYDNCVEDEEEEPEEEDVGEEENERGGEPERSNSPNNIGEEEPRASNQEMVAIEGSEGAGEGFIVVASLTSTSEVERPQIVGSSSVETGRDGVSNVQHEQAEVHYGSKESTDPINSKSSGCLQKAQSEVQQPTEANSPLKGDLNTDPSNQCSEKSIHTDAKPTVSGNANKNKDVEPLSSTNKTQSSESTERLQKVKTLDLSSGGFSSSLGKTVQMQSSLEVACHSVATSPMTPPEGSAAFLFPYSSAKTGMVSANTAENKEFKSVATAPMSPQNLTAPEAIPEARSAGVEMRSVATAPMSPLNLTAPESIPEACTAGVMMRSVATAPMSPQNLTAPEAIPDAHTAGLEMRSVATAPMTPQNLTAPESFPEAGTAGVMMRSVATAPMSPQNLTAPEAIPDAHTAGVEMRSVATAPMTPQNLTAPESFPEACTAGVMMRSVATAPMSPQNLTAPEAIPDAHTAGLEMRSVATAPMSPRNLTAPEAIPEACKVGSVKTRVSLEVMCHSVATSPMTPPEGSAVFLFPSSKHVELRSVATAPMSPQGLTAPEAIPEACTAGAEQTAPEFLPEPRELEADGGPQEPLEPLQDVCWDEKGMTWDVYGAVVEVMVLGTAIQKHLEKQVQKHHKQPSSGTASPTQSQTQTQTQNESVAEAQSPADGASTPATGLTPAGSQKSLNQKEKNDGVKRNGRRRNPLRVRFRRFKWPSCCSRSRPEEVL